MTQQPTNLATTDLARERTGLARFRTQLALDRTTLAWVRTTLTMLTFGFGMVGFFRTLTSALLWRPVATLRVAGWPRGIL